ASSPSHCRTSEILAGRPSGLLPGYRSSHPLAGVNLIPPLVFSPPRTALRCRTTLVSQASQQLRSVTRTNIVRRLKLNQRRRGVAAGGLGGGVFMGGAKNPFGRGFSRVL